MILDTGHPVFSSGSWAGTGAYTTWLDRGQLADAALALVVDHWRATDQAGWADTVAQYGWDASCRHPDITEAVATLRAAPGTAADLTAAIAIIDTALTTAEGSTAPGWTRLEARRAHLAGLLRRVRSGRPTPSPFVACGRSGTANRPPLRPGRLSFA